MDNESNNDSGAGRRDGNHLDRREFLEDAAIISTLTATWWGVTMKTDAVAHAQENGTDAMLKGGDPALRDYHYTS